MDEKLVNAMLVALTEQRDQALNAAAQFKAHLTVLNAENNDLKKMLSEKEDAAGAQPADLQNSDTA